MFSLYISYAKFFLTRAMHRQIIQLNEFCLNKYLCIEGSLCFLAPALSLAPSPGPGLRPFPPFVFTGPGPQLIFTGPGPEFVFTSPGQDFTTTTVLFTTTTINNPASPTTTTTATTTATTTNDNNNNKKCIRCSKICIKWPLKDIC